MRVPMEWRKAVAVATILTTAFGAFVTWFPPAVVFVFGGFTLLFGVLFGGPFTDTELGQ